MPIQFYWNCKIILHFLVVFIWHQHNKIRFYSFDIVFSLRFFIWFISLLFNISKSVWHNVCISVQWIFFSLYLTYIYFLGAIAAIFLILFIWSSTDFFLIYYKHQMQRHKVKYVLTRKWNRAKGLWKRFFFLTLVSWIFDSVLYSEIINIQCVSLITITKRPYFIRTFSLFFIY